MSMNKSYAVFGLGKYGIAVAKELVNHGVDVLAVDCNQQLVNEAASFLPLCKCADVTDEEVIEQLAIRNFDVVIIAMGSSLEASVMATALCKEAGVPRVIAKCTDRMQQKILSKVGADEIVLPEEESGKRFAQNLLSSGFIDLINLSEDVSVVELDLKPEWVGKNLLELNLRKKYSINVVAIKQNENICIDINPESPLESNTKLIVIATNSKLKHL